MHHAALSYRQITTNPISLKVYSSEEVFERLQQHIEELKLKRLD